MTFEGDYFFRGVLRWNLGWANPNLAGAFLATALPWWWAANGFCMSRLRQSERTGWQRAGCVLLALLAIECLLWWCLAKTYSRGGLLAAAGALLVWVALATRTQGGAWWLASRGAIAAAVIFASGFAGRVSPDYVTADGAVGNRLELWRGALRMLWAAPLGWGEGESGRVFMNWFQAADRDEGYVTPVNSYLHLGTEYGVLLLGAVWLTLAWVLLVALGAVKAREGDSSSARGGRWALCAAASSLVAWGVANVFTTLWLEPKLWIVPSAAIAVITFNVGRLEPRCLIRIFAISAMAAALSIGGLLGAGASFTERNDPVIAPHVASSISVRRPTAQASAAGGVWHLWPDPEVFGPLAGKDIRRWAIDPRSPHSMLVHPPSRSHASSGPAQGDTVVLCGRQVVRLPEWKSADGVNVIIVHPIGPAPEVGSGKKIARNMTVVLPEIDARGTHGLWRTWARLAGARLLISPGAGTDIREAWSTVMLEQVPSAIASNRHEQGSR